MRVTNQNLLLSQAEDQVVPVIVAEAVSVEYCAGHHTSVNQSHTILHETVLIKH